MFCNVVDTRRALDVRGSRRSSCLSAATERPEMWRGVCWVATDQVGAGQLPAAQQAACYDGRIFAGQGSPPCPQPS